MHLSSVLPVLALSTLTVARLHIVRVAPNGDMVFSPNTIQAASGDQIQFNFPAGGDYSVARGNWDDACQPANDNNDDGDDDDDDDAYDDWYSGFVSEGTWTVTIPDGDDSYPFYSTGSGQCQGGMVGVINPSNDNDDDDNDETLEAYRSDASMESGSTSPSTVQGGVFRSAGSGATSTASASASGMSATTSSMPTPTSSENGAGQLLINSIAGTIPLGIMAYVLL